MIEKGHVQALASTYLPAEIQPKENRIVRRVKTGDSTTVEIKSSSCAVHLPFRAQTERHRVSLTRQNFLRSRRSPVPFFHDLKTRMPFSCILLCVDADGRRDPIFDKKPKATAEKCRNWKPAAHSVGSVSALQRESQKKKKHDKTRASLLDALSQ